MTRLPVSPCPKCGSKNDTASGIEKGTTPVIGDIAVCLKCGDLRIYTLRLGLRNPSPSEMNELLSDPEIQLIQSIIKEMR